CVLRGAAVPAQDSAAVGRHADGSERPAPRGDVRHGQLDGAPQHLLGVVWHGPRLHGSASAGAPTPPAPRPGPRRRAPSAPRGPQPRGPVRTVTLVSLPRNAP